MTQPINFSNFGYMFDTIPEHLFKKIKEESSRLEFENSRMVSGLTGNGVAKHFYMNENYQREFVEYVMHLKDVYLNTYKDYLSMFRCFSNSVPFVCDKPWYNIQRKHEFVPNHTHDGFLSYTAWLQVPYDSATETSNGSSYASCFEFTYVGATGTVLSEMIPVDKSYEGKIIMFPSAFTHCVYPFYTSDSTRISIAGNILFDTIKSKI